MHAYTDPHAILESTDLVERFLAYVQIDTQSDPHSKTRPSTEKQRVLLNRLVEELKALGLSDAHVDDGAFCLATLPGTVDAPALGLIAHVDTSPAFSGTDVKPVLHQGYDGSAIALKNGVTISPDDNPELLRCVGDTVITADGTTLLGADDKAGVAEIMATLEVLVAHPELPRPPLCIAFTPDEEIGRGAEGFPYASFGAAAAVTLDGGFPGEVNFETFSADSAYVTVRGVSTHPGTAKGKLVNALEWMARLIERLPPLDRPEHTEGREGFIHLDELSGNAAECTAHLILRDFEDDALAARGEIMKRLGTQLMEEEPRLSVEVRIERSYRNMRMMREMRPELIGVVRDAVRAAGLEPDEVPVRGGTDGSRLTEGGLPTPNLFAGGLNFHGPMEWVSTRAMGLATCTVLNLVQLWAERNQR